ncbi:MAG: carbohydrate kinase family protein [Candidatus Bathyarchaeia archaeon]|nr:carbohydrate kinase family protein [Candidatus Bathyarchaeota archaeon]
MNEKIKNLDLIGIGAANVDLIIKIDDFPKPDEEVKILNIQFYGGGSAANVVTEASRLGLKTGFIGNVGEDYFGKFLMEEFKKEKVDFSKINIVSGESTGLALCIVDKFGERVIMVYGGANSKLSLTNIDEEYLKECKALFLSSVEGPEALKTMEYACEIVNDAIIFFDPGCLFANKGLNALKKIISYSTIVKVNEVELKKLTNEKNIVEGAEKIKSLGPKIVLVTLGIEGCYVLSEKEEFKVPTYLQFKPLDKTGAGDAFNAGFLTGFLKGWNLKKAVKFGNLIASISITRFGARAAPNLNELKNYSEAKEFLDLW